MVLVYALLFLISSRLYQSFWLGLSTRFFLLLPHPSHVLIISSARHLSVPPWGLYYPNIQGFGILTHPAFLAISSTVSLHRQCAYMLSHFSCVRLFMTPWIIPTRLFWLWDSPGKNTGVGCHDILQGIFPTQKSEPTSLGSPTLAGRFFTTGATWEAHIQCALQPRWPPAAPEHALCLPSHWLLPPAVPAPWSLAISLPPIPLGPSQMPSPKEAILT